MFYGGLGIVAIIFFIKHAKSYATAITTNYKEFNDWETLKGAFDILKNAYSEFDEKKSQLQNLVEQLNELGVDSAEVDDLENKFYGVEQEFNGLFSNFENLGFYS